MNRQSSAQFAKSALLTIVVFILVVLALLLEALSQGGVP